jgi:hypothetical protein
VALLFLLRPFVLHLNLASTGHTRAYQNESAVGVDGKSFRIFLKLFALRVFPANMDGHLHQYTLAAATHA